MKLSNRHIAEAVVAELSAGASRGKIAKSVAAYMVAERRSKDIDAVTREVARLLEVQSGQREVSVVSAQELPETTKQQLVKMFKGDAKHVVVNEIIDPSVIGGVKVESSTSRLDLTIRRRLQRLKEMGA